jgi:hypothetical protein
MPVFLKINFSISPFLNGNSSCLLSEMVPDTMQSASITTLVNKSTGVTSNGLVIDMELEVCDKFWCGDKFGDKVVIEDELL